MRAALVLFVLAALGTLAACASEFSGRQEDYIADALKLQASVLADPRFGEILVELDEREEITWDRRLLSAARAQAADYPLRASWLRERYAALGGLPRERIVPWLNRDANSNTTAVHEPVTGIVRLNLRRFYRDEAALVNTFVHEQSHTFGLVHVGQTRQPNRCDAAYIAGDIAEALARSDGRPKRTSPHGPPCPALCGALDRRELWKHHACG